jgi:hypothetical protein
MDAIFGEAASISPEFRRIFVIHTTPGATQPIVSTIVDTTVAAPPAAPAAN